MALHREVLPALQPPRVIEHPPAVAPSGSPEGSDPGSPGADQAPRSTLPPTTPSSLATGDGRRTICGQPPQRLIMGRDRGNGHASDTPADRRRPLKTFHPKTVPAEVTQGQRLRGKRRRSPGMPARKFRRSTGTVRRFGEVGARRPAEPGAAPKGGRHAEAPPGPAARVRHRKFQTVV